MDRPRSPIEYNSIHYIGLLGQTDRQTDGGTLAIILPSRLTRPVTVTMFLRKLMQCVCVTWNCEANIRRIFDWFQEVEKRLRDGLYDGFDWLLAGRVVSRYRLHLGGVLTALVHGRPASRATQFCHRIVNPLMHKVERQIAMTSKLKTTG